MSISALCIASTGPWRDDGLCPHFEAAARLSRDFAAHAQDRRYLAVLQGELREERAMDDWLLKGADGMVRVVGPDTAGAKRALLTSRPLAVRGGAR